jgi:hypothetical protein
MHYRDDEQSGEEADPVNPSIKVTSWHDSRKTVGRLVHLQYQHSSHPGLSSREEIYHNGRQTSPNHGHR